MDLKTIFLRWNMRGLLTLKELKTEKIIELVEYAIKIKNGYKV